MGNSFYVQISPYLLLEYTYGDSSTTYISNQVKLSRIKNAYTGQVQFLNGSASETITQNVLDTSATNLGGYKWVFLDKDVPVPYINTDSNLTFTDMSNLLTSLNVVYDKVKIHIVSGYRLEDLQGLIIQIYGREALTSNISILANNVYLNSDSRDILNPKPILLGEKMYDRYIEVLVPSIKNINTTFYSDNTNPVSIGYQYTSDNGGFLYNSSIYVKVYEINNVERKNGIMFLYTSDNYEAVINQEDVYSLLSANISEASDGDYFTYYPSYDGNFIEDFIANLNAAGGSYVAINDLDVYEQVGLDNILTFSFSQVQSEGFDSPLNFRPILKYAGSAVAFSIDYVVRIYNRENGFQIIRRSSTTSFNPKKYGKQLEKIALAEQSYPLKVYNKIYGKSPISFVGNDYTPSFSTVYVPVFYESRNVLIQYKNVLSKGANPIDANFYDNINFGQGDARIYLSDFDSYFKFKISQLDSSGSILPIDLTAGTILIAFKDSVGNMISFPAENSDSSNSKASGEVVFKLPDYLRKKILVDSNVHNFYLLSENAEKVQTLIYTGTVDKIENINNENLRVKSLSLSSVEIGTTASGTSVSSTSSNPSQSSSILSQLNNSNSESLNVIEVNPPTIPNYTFDTGAASVKTGITPASDKSTSQSQINTNLSQSSSSTTTLNK